MFLRVITTLTLVSCVLCNSVDIVVDTPLGTVRGWERESRDGRLYQAWTGIPYAQPPIGELRFKPPKPAFKWEGVLNATNDMTMCLQKMVKGCGKGSEDCLYLSVYRPKKVLVEKLPVIVHVHGGAYQIGDASRRENPDYFMDEDVLLVAMHYRLNGFGFMSLGNKVMPGNFGLKDQVMALRWISDNVAAFGGDPNSVTLIGESAGGASTHILLNSPATSNLVSRAWSNSGAIAPFRSLRKPGKIRVNTLRVAVLSGCPSNCSDTILKCLQRVNATTLLETISKVGEEQDVPYSPVIEPNNAEDAVATYDLSSTPANKPWVTGMCSGEYSFYMSSLGEATVKNAQENLPGYLQHMIRDRMKTQDQGLATAGANALKDVYFPVTEPLKTFKEELAMMWADATYLYPPVRNVLNHRAPKWLYWFEYVGELFSAGPRKNFPQYANVSGHAATTPFFFNIRSKYPGVSPRQNEADYKISKMLVKYVVNFAYFDDPTPPGSSLIWKQYNSTEILKISNDSVSFEEGSYFNRFLNILNFWSYWSNWHM